jgi:hypothetical protein
MSDYNLIVDIFNDIKKSEDKEEKIVENIETNNYNKNEDKENEDKENEDKENEDKENEDKENEDKENEINEDLEKILGNSVDNLLKNENIEEYDERIKYNENISKKIRDDEFFKKLNTYNLLINNLNYTKIELDDFENKEDKIKFSLKTLIEMIHNDIPEVNLNNLFEEIKDKKLNRKEILVSIETKINHDFISKNELIENIEKYIESIDIIVYIFNKIIYNNNEYIKTILEILKKNNYLESFVKEMKYTTFDNISLNKENIIKILDIQDYDLLKLYLEDYDYKNTSILIHAKQNLINNKSEEMIKIYRYLTYNYNKVIKYKNKEHKKFCQDVDIYNIPNIFIETKITYNLYTIYMLPSNIKYVKDINEKYIEPGFVEICIKNEDNYNFSLIYKQLDYNVNIDMKWYKKMLKYLYKLNFEDKFTVRCYTKVGTKFINKYLLNELSYNDIDFIVSEIEVNIKKEKNPILPFYPQIMKFLNIYNFNEMIEHLKKYNRKYLYRLIVKITPFIIEDLQRIIENSPPLEKSFILYRGVQDVYYPLNKEYTTNSFTSTTLNLEIAKNFGKKQNTTNLIKFKLKKGDKCLFVEPLTAFNTRQECEFLINIGKKLNIDKKVLKIPYKRDKSITNSSLDLCNFDYKTLNITTFYS